MKRQWYCKDCGSTNLGHGKCIREGCEERVFADQRCKAHYAQRWRRLRGEVSSPYPDPKPDIDHDDGFWEQVDRHTRERMGM